MSMKVSFTLDDHSADIKTAFENCSDEFLEALGIQGSDNVRRAITASGHVDTGLMRNSITYALSGQPAAISTYSGDNPSKRNPKAPIPSGTYAGKSPPHGIYGGAVYVGSNLDYFVFQNEGYHRPDGTFVPGIHALQDGMTQLQGQAEEIARKVYESMGG